MIIVMGLPGAGKSTVLKSLKTDYKILNWGDLMFEIEKKEFGIKDRDEMRKIPIDKQKWVQEMVAKTLSKMPGKIILDTHCSVSTPSGYFPGLPFDILKLLPVKTFVLITANPDDVAKRRNNDPNRKRDSDDIHLHDQMNKSFLASYSAFTGAPAVIIENKEGKIEESVSKLQSLLK
jgi:adenylate kinase